MWPWCILKKKDGCQLKYCTFTWMWKISMAVAHWCALCLANSNSEMLFMNKQQNSASLFVDISC